MTLQTIHDKLDGMVVKALTDVFKTMLQTQIQLESISHPVSPDGGGNVFQTVEETIVVGNVGFVGKISGIAYLSMPEQAARLVAFKMLGLDSLEEADHELVNDVIGELTNMSAGTFKNQLADIGYPCALTIPSIIRGKYFVMDTTDASWRIFCQFRHEDRPVTLEIQMKEEAG